MESEKMLVVGMLTTIIVVGLVIGASLATLDPGGTTDDNTTTSSTVHFFLDNLGHQSDVLPGTALGTTL